MARRAERKLWGGIGLLGALVLAMVAPAYAQEGAVRLYIAPNGNDSWSGAPAEPNAAKTDGPLASLAGARDALRKMRATGKISGPVHVQLRAGAYFVAEPVLYTPDDSGAAAAPIFYEAYPGEQPVIHGGRVLSGWKQEGDLWTVEIPDVREGKWPFSALWVNGERRTPARMPNSAHLAGDEPVESDCFYTQGPVIEKDAAGKEGKSATRFCCRPGDLKAWDDLGDAVIVVYHSWETSLLRVKNLDEAKGIVEFTGPAAWPFGYWTNRMRYYVEHLFEALDQPGEWYLNRKTGKLYYLPMPGEDMAKVEVVAPVAKQLLVIEGKPAEGKFVEHLNFYGLRFYYTEYTIEPQGHSDSQAAAGVPAAIQATGARRCNIEHCEVGHVGSYGVWFRAGCRDNRLTHSELFDLGAGGVRIGEAGDPASDNEAALRNVVDNNFIHDGGRIFRGAVGAWIGRSSYNRFSHNDLCDFRYTGVSVGWSWGYAPSSANHNIVEYNQIHHVGRGQLSDLGGIYTLGVSPGTVIQYNVFHDVMSYAQGYGGWGIYFDEGSTDILAENNVVYGTLTGTLHQHYGRDNRVQNNIFAFSHGAQLIRSREEQHCSFFFERNIVYYNNGLLLGSNWTNGNFYLDGNCYWDTSGQPPEFANRTLAEWQGLGHDVHSIAADPLFVNAEAGDFHLKPDSPAVKLGFAPIDVTLVGLYGEPEWVDKPKGIPRELFTPPKPPQPVTIGDGFEETPVGAPANGAATLGEEGAALIRITDETAASGKRSLKFTDAPGLQFAFNPHLVYRLHLGKGHAVGRFAVRMEPGAVLFHEWRDGRSPYQVGPSLWINGAGDLAVGGKTLLKVPHSQWVRIQIECGLGKEATGTFTLIVTLPGQDPQPFAGLVFGSQSFRQLDWFGFVSNATETAVFYLDDVALEAK
jgi:hypothetical protein